MLHDSVPLRAIEWPNGDRIVAGHQGIKTIIVWMVGNTPWAKVSPGDDLFNLALARKVELI